MTDENKHTVLIVDDDPFISDLLTRKFSDSGFITRHAHDGNDALKQLEAGPLPQVVLLDIMMPNVDGFEVLKKMKEDHRFSSIPVGVLSNSGNEADIDKAKSLGALFYMLKIDAPLEEIVAKVKSAAIS